MKNFFEIILVSLILLGWFFLSYHGAFFVCLANDVDFRYGKKRMKNRRKKQKGFWRKFLFLDIRKEVIKWHYYMFWINLISFVPMLIAINIFVVCNAELAKYVFYIAGGIYFLTDTIMAFSYFQLYAGNKARSKKKYRQKNRQS